MPAERGVLLATLFALAVSGSGCVMGMGGFVVTVDNDTDERISVHIGIADVLTGTTAFERVVDVAAGGHIKMKDLGLWEGDLEARIVVPERGMDVKSRISDTCGSCLFHVRVTPEGIRMGTDVFD